MALYLLMLVILIEQNETRAASLQFSALSASMLFRQTNMTLSAAFLFNKALLNLKSGRSALAGFSSADLIPLLAAAAFAAFLFYAWGGLVPSYSRVHVAVGLNLVALVHLFALIPIP